MLEELPEELLRFNSEYHYLFSTLYHFDKAGTGDSTACEPSECRSAIHGGIRRNHDSSSGSLHSKMKKVFPNEIERERVWKFINQYSHNTSVTRSLTIPDISECKAVVQGCLKAVRDWNVEYFNDLEAEVK